MPEVDSQPKDQGRRDQIEQNQKNRADGNLARKAAEASILIFCRSHQDDSWKKINMRVEEELSRSNRIFISELMEKGEDR